jgi:flagellar basal body L-ring protein FlgH
MSKKSKKFQMAASLNSEKDVFAADSTEIGAPSRPALFQEKSEVWSYFRNVPYKAQVLRVHKSAARRAAAPEWLYFVTWSQFGKEWDCYLWEDTLIASTKDVCTTMLAEQRTAFTAKKRRASSSNSTGNNGNTNADGDDDASDGNYGVSSSAASASTAAGSNKRAYVAMRMIRCCVCRFCP